MHIRPLAIALCGLTCMPVMWSASAAPLSPLTFAAHFDGSLEATGPNGTVQPVAVSGKVEYQPGKVGQALVVGGDAAQVKFPVRGLVRPTQGTIEMWVNAQDWPQDEQAFHILFETEGPGWLVLYKFWNGGLLMLTGMDKAHYTSAFWEQGDLPREGWHHLAGSWSRERVKVYLDGKLQRETPFPALPRELTGWFNLGDEGWMKPHTSHTLLDEVKIYRYALPDEQIARLARGEALDYHQGMPVEIEPHPARGQWKVSVDASGYVGPDGAATRAVVTVLSGGEESARAEISDFTDGVGVDYLDISRVPPGESTVRVTMLDDAGQEITRTDTSFSKPEKSDWEGSRVGLDQRVIPPFTEITVGGVAAVEARAPQGRSVECWGRKYAMDGLLPTQIESAGEPLLAEPITLTASGAAGETVWEETTAEVSGWSPTAAHCRSAARSKDLSLTVDTRIEYDGMLWSDLTLTPAKSVELTGLTLHIPLRAEHARYVHHVRPSWLEDDAGLLPDEGYEAKGFLPYIWLGDEDRGLAWFAESERGWTAGSGKPVVQVTRQGDRVDLRIQIINVPTNLDKPLRLGFGLQATPVKPRPEAARGWRLGNLGTSDTLQDPSQGNMQIIWPNGNLLAYGYPWPADPDKFRQQVRDLQAKGIRVVPYVNLNFLAVPAPEFAYYSPDWLDSARCFNTGDVAQMGGATLGACPSVPAWHDFIATKLARFVDEFEVDGIYVDCWNPSACLVEEHGCGWRDDAGNLRGRFSILGSREIVRRAREILTDRRPEAHIMIHMSTSVCIPMLSFADSMLDGEQYQATTKDPADDYLNVVPLDKWRAQNTGLQWGVLPYFLPEFSGENRVKAYPTERLMGLMLAHDCSPWPIWCNSKVIFDAWDLLDRFGIVDAEFMPYWKPNGVTSQQPQSVVSVYRKQGAALLVVLNTSPEDAETTLQIDPQKLGLPEGFTARMAADDTPVQVRDGSFKVALAARGYSLVVLR